MIEQDPLNQAIKNYSPKIKSALTELRDLIAETAKETEGVNAVSGSLKWGQPSYEAINPKSGSPFRIDAIKNSDTKYAMYFICTTTLVQDMRERYSDSLKFEGNRAVIFDVASDFPKEEVKHCIAMALTYKLNK